MENLPYVSTERDRHGILRYCFRRGATRCRLRGQPGDPEFHRVYAKLMGHEVEQAQPVALNQSFGWLVDLYIDQMETEVVTGAMSDSTRRQHRSFLLRLKARFADKKKMIPPHRINELMFEFSPAQGNNLRRTLNALYRWAKLVGHVAENPVDEVKSRKYKTNGFAPWEHRHLKQFLEVHPPSTTPGLAETLLACTAARRSDAVTLGKTNIVTYEGRRWLRWKQEKQMGSVEIVEVPILPPLDEALRSPACGDFMFLLTKYGRPFSKAGFGNAMRKWVKEAGLPDDLAAHGIRKAVSTLLYEWGCSDNEIAAVLGHHGTKTVSVYTATAKRRVLVATAMSKLENMTL